MKIVLRIILVVFLAFTAFEVNLALDFFWYENVVNKLTYPIVLGFTEAASVVADMPTFVLYFMIGLFLFDRNSKYIWIFAVVALVFQTYLISYGFTEHSTLQIKVWVYASYFFPSIAAILGYKLNQRLTRNKTTVVDRTLLQRARL